MKVLAIILVCFVAAVSLADRRGQLLAARGYSDPSGSNTLYAWWHSSDLVLGNVVQNTNPWIDRVQQRLLRNASGTATNSSQGVATFVTSSSGLTNAPTTQGSNSTYCIIFKVSDITLAGGGNPVTALSGPYDLSDGTQLVTPGGFNFKLSTAVMYWGQWSVPGGQIISGRITNNTYDVIASQNASTMTIYTNGIQSASITALPPLTGWPWFFAGWDTISAANVFPGYIKEILIYTNSFSLQQVTNLHYYATNQYGYAP